MSNADNASFVQYLCKHISLALLTKSIVVTLKWARWRLQSPVSRLFTQPFVQAQNMENVEDDVGIKITTVIVPNCNHHAYECNYG